jgi:iron complex outermembrane receptor protein
MPRWFHTFTFAIVLVLCVLCGPGARQLAAQQQTGTVSGTATSTLTGEPVPDATVLVEAPNLSRQGRSGPDGRFSVTDVPPGPYHVVVRANGFLPFRLEVTVAAGPQTVDVPLNPELHFSEITSVAPEATSQFESFQATNVLGGQDLAQALQNTLGATIENEPGIALRSFGPGPARPVVRGLDGDRVLIVEDGLRMGDLSSQSGDHGLNVNPASASSIEVVRGPATLLYGANAIGGLVNVITNEIPRTPVQGVTGGVTFDAGSAASEAAGAGDVTVGNGRLALHFSGSGRRAGNYKSPDGEVPNSYSRSAFGEVGLSTTSDNGYFGGSYAFDRSHYAIPLVEEGQTNLDPRRHVLNVRGERRNMAALFQSLRGSFGIRRYKHDELDGEEVATSFENNTMEMEALGGLRQMGRMKGSIGGSMFTRAFSTAGAEALSPEVDQKGGAAYLYEEINTSAHVTLQFGGRIEHQRFTPKADEPARDFTNFSGSVGLLLMPTDAATIALSFARAARNPALEELYFHGAHPGNAAIENGNPDLQAEIGLGFDASVRWRHAAASGEVTVFVNQINNFIFRELTGEVEDDLPVTVFTQGDARLRGIESHVDFKLGDYVWVEAGLDYVNGQLTSIDQPLPRIPPLRGRLGLRFQRNAFQAGFQETMTARQDRIYVVNGVGETPTDGYNLLKLFASYSFGSSRTVNTISVRLDNATNERYFNHLNFLKDVLNEAGVSEAGRDFRVVYSVKF